MDESSRTAPCDYHPGEAEFHEGSKGWLCCKTRMLEFAEFLKIPGCFTEKHRFTPDSTKFKIKYDFYQLGNFVMVTFYSKNVKRQESTVKFSPHIIHVNLVLSNGERYTDDIVLAKPIVPEASKYEVLSTKVEVKLKKATTEEWNHFNLADDSVIII